jgi:ADP-ribose pyrophosphatase
MPAERRGENQQECGQDHQREKRRAKRAHLSFGSDSAVTGPAVVPPVAYLSAMLQRRSVGGYEKEVLRRVESGDVGPGQLQSARWHTPAMSVDRMQETLVDRVEVARGKLIHLRLDTVVDAEGERHLREVVVHRGGVAIIALTDDDNVLMVRQYRHAVGEVLFEIPAGTLDLADDGGTESPDGAARRELAEETGFEAGKWTKLGLFYTAPGFATEVMHLYLARDLRPIDGYDGPEADEHLELEQVPFDAVLRLAERGEIRDAKTLVGLFWVARLTESGELTESGQLAGREDAA